MKQSTNKNKFDIASYFEASKYGEFHQFDSLDVKNLDLIKERIKGKRCLLLTDPPYIGILKNNWDQGDAYQFTQRFLKAIYYLELDHMLIFQGIGKYMQRTFIHLIHELEQSLNYQLVDFITWLKKKSFGTENRYCFLREEILWFEALYPKTPRVFNKPYQPIKRECNDMNPKYPSKSPYLRQGNVITHISEIFQGKLHPTQKPYELLKLFVEAHTKKGDIVLDLFAGSCSLWPVCHDLERYFIGVDLNDPRLNQKT